MSLNSAVTPSGREIGRAQAAQAEACGLLPNEHMNPVLLKPTSETGSQVVVQGKVYGNASAREYFGSHKDALWERVVESYHYLEARHDIIVLEGAGSPVEMNLKPRDITNMRAAELADAAVLLVADIDRGGVFASVVGTLQLLEPAERARVKGIVINRFRGDPALFEDGVKLMEQYTNIPVLGVIPFIKDIGIDEEDSVALASGRYRQTPTAKQNRLRIAVIQLPHMANFTDIDPLFIEPDVDVLLCERPEELEGATAVLLPGTKNTLDDLAWLQTNGFFEVLHSLKHRETAVLGICGGYQMLGDRVLDPHHTESSRSEASGLGFFSGVTTMLPEKRTVLVRGALNGVFSGIPVNGYEIHMGATRRVREHPFACVREHDVQHELEEGFLSDDGLLIGTYLHGILHNDGFRTAWLNLLRERHGLSAQPQQNIEELRSKAYDRLADIVSEHLDMSAIERLLKK